MNVRVQTTRLACRAASLSVAAIAAAVAISLALPRAAVADETAAVAVEATVTPEAVVGTSAGAESLAAPVRDFTDELLEVTAERPGVPVLDHDITEEIRVIIEASLQHVGTPYHFGGTTPKSGFDCSGLVNYVFRQTVGAVLPRVARDLARIGTPVTDVADLRPGDLIFFNTRGFKNSHVGIFLGGTSFIHAPTRGSFVRVDDMSDPYFVKHYNGARRVNPLDWIAAPAAAKP